MWRHTQPKISFLQAQAKKHKSENSSFPQAKAKKYQKHQVKKKQAHKEATKQSAQRNEDQLTARDVLPYEVRCPNETIGDV